MTITWNLDRCLENSRAFLRELVIALSMDNVQMFAILACQGLGNTIAIAPGTIKIIEKLVIPTPEAFPIRFLKGYVGFSTTDAATQLGRNEAGLRFLALASALIPSMRLSKAAAVLHSMLLNSTTDYDTVPSARNLEDLLAALEPRCAFSGFTDLLVAWHTRLFNYSIVIAREQELNHFGAFPEVSELEKLINVLRQCYRIGEAREDEITRITMRTRGCTVWVAAFTEWCLGFQPAVFIHDGKQISGSKDPHICIVHLPIDPSQASLHSFALALDHTISGFETLVENGEVNSDWRGMPSIEEYGKWLLQTTAMDFGDSKRAFEDLLPYALYAVIEGLRFGTYHQYNYEAGLESWYHEGTTHEILRSHLPSEFSKLTLCPFPEQHVVALMLSRLTGIRGQRVKPLENGLRVTDLPFVKLHLEDLKAHCSCFKCTNQPLESFDGPYNPCERDKFLETSPISSLIFLHYHSLPSQTTCISGFRYAVRGASIAT